MGGNVADGIVKAKLGGKEYILRAELRLAPLVEAKTGKGIYTVARSINDLSATTSEVAAVIGAALEVNGRPLDGDELYEAIGVEGITAAYALATALLFELLKPPKIKKSKNGVAVPAPN
jgi:hypothetical protein